MPINTENARIKERPFGLGMPIQVCPKALIQVQKSTDQSKLKKFNGLSQA